jgi:hypothetical protein
VICVRVGFLQLTVGWVVVPEWNAMPAPHFLTGPQLTTALSMPIGQVRPYMGLGRLPGVM